MSCGLKDTYVYIRIAISEGMHGVRTLILTDSLPSVIVACQLVAVGCAKSF